MRGFNYGFNLAGGVTPNHLKSQIFEWLENVRRLWFRVGPPSAPRPEADDRPAEMLY